MEGLISLTRKTSPSNFYYVCEKNGDSLSEKMDELACFVPGMLALGASGYRLEKAEKIMNLAEEVILLSSPYAFHPEFLMTYFEQFYKFCHTIQHISLCFSSFCHRSLLPIHNHIAVPNHSVTATPVSISLLLPVKKFLKLT